jgi:hypothetical protein
MPYRFVEHEKMLLMTNIAVLNVECHYAKGRYAECRYAECHGATSNGEIKSYSACPLSFDILIYSEPTQ